MKRYFLIFAMASLMFLGISCDKTDDADDRFIVIDYEPDIVINQYDTVFFDINLDGKNDFKAYIDICSPDDYRMFKSVIDSSCVFSSVLYGDSINNTIKWQDYEWWCVYNEDSPLNNMLYLVIKLKSDDGVNYGWLLPRIKGKNNNISLIIDKAVYCKIKNKGILAGHERLD